MYIIGEIKERIMVKVAYLAQRVFNKLTINFQRVLIANGRCQSRFSPPKG